MFDQIRRSPSGRYWCSPQHAAAEQRAREADRVKKLEVLARRTMPHRPAEDEKAARVNQLRNLGTKWDDVRKQVEQEFKIYTTVGALQALLKRYRKRQEPMKQVS